MVCMVCMVWYGMYGILSEDTYKEINWDREQNEALNLERTIQNYIQEILKTLNLEN